MSDQRAFLKSVGWGEAEIAPLPGDASTRRYARLRHDARQAMLMDQPQAAESAVAAPGADEAARRALGYNAVARLAGADCRRFAAVSNYLSARGLSAPKILAADYGQGLLVIEAMKMQNEVRSPKSGTVERVLVSEGQAVNAGDALATIT